MQAWMSGRKRICEIKVEEERREKEGECVEKETTFQVTNKLSLFQSPTQLILLLQVILVSSISFLIIKFVTLV